MVSLHGLEGLGFRGCLVLNDPRDAFSLGDWGTPPEASWVVRSPKPFFLNPEASTLKPQSLNPTPKSYIGSMGRTRLTGGSIGNRYRDLPPVEFTFFKVQGPGFGFIRVI